MLYAYKKQLILITILIILAGAGFAVYNYLHSFQYVTVNYDKSEGVVKLYGPADSKDTAPQTLIPNEKQKVKKGNYTLKWSGEHIAADEQSITVRDTPATATVIFRFSDAYLAELLQKEYPRITDVINQAYPKLPSLYTLSRAKLYDRGEWFGAVLTYKGKDSLNRDTLRLLAKKDNGAWKLMTTPPAPLLSTKAYPDAPQAVIQDINQPAPLPGAPHSPPLTANGDMISPND